MKRIIFTAFICSALCLVGCIVYPGEPSYWYPRTPAESIATDYRYYVEVEIYQNDMTTPIDTDGGYLTIYKSNESDAVRIRLHLNKLNYGVDVSKIPITGEISNVRMEYQGRADLSLPYLYSSGSEIDLTGWVRDWNATRCSPSQPDYVYYKIDMTIEFEAYNEGEGITDNIKLVIKKDSGY